METDIEDIVSIVSMKSELPDAPELIAAFFGPTPEPDPTRDRILRHARTKFHEIGFARVTVEELCRDLRMAKKTFYRYFKNRDELVEALFAEGGRAIVPRAIEILSSGRPAGEVLREYFQFVARTLPEYASAAIMEDAEIHMPHLWDRFVRLRATVLARLEEVVAAGVRDGSIDPAVDPRAYARIMLALVNRVGSARFLRENDLTFESAVRVITRLAAGIVKPEPQREVGHE